MAATIPVTGYPVASGKPDLTAKSIPFLFSTNVLVDFTASTILREIANTEYEKELKGGGYSIRIRRNTQVTVSGDYVSGGGYTVQEIDRRYLDFPVDKNAHYAFPENVIDQYQSDVNDFEEAGVDAAKEMRIFVEEEVFTSWFLDATHSGATAGRYSNIDLGSTGSPLVATANNILDKIAEWNQILNHVNTPKDGRYVVIDPTISTMLQTSDLRNASWTGTQSKLIHPDAIMQINGFTIYESNLQSTTTDGADTVLNAHVGHKSACGFVMQMEITEVKPRYQEFGSYTAGLNIYGRKVLRPDNLIHAYLKVA